MADIVILGCGLSGMLSALTLSRYGFSSIIIDQKNLQLLERPEDARTTALNPSSIDFIKKNGLWDLIEAYIQKIKHIYVCQNMSDDMLHLESKNEPLGYMIENKIFRQKLFQAASNDENIKIMHETKYTNIVSTANGCEIEIESLIDQNSNQKLLASFCIAADGKFSEIRKTHFSSRLNKDYKQKAIVFNIFHNIAHNHGAIEHFLPRGTFATLPLLSQNQSSIVWVEEKKIADFYISQTDEFIVNAISKFTGNSLGDIELITKPESYPLSASIVKGYYCGRIALVADSAHTIHPLAGQGLNMGIKDIEALCFLAKEYDQLGLEMDEFTLEKYESKRKFDNMNMLRITDSVNKIFTLDCKPLHFMTKKGLALLDKIPFAKNTLISYASGKRDIFPRVKLN